MRIRWLWWLYGWVFGRAYECGAETARSAGKRWYVFEVVKGRRRFAETVFILRQGSRSWVAAGFERRCLPASVFSHWLCQHDTHVQAFGCGRQFIVH